MLTLIKMLFEDGETQDLQMLRNASRRCRCRKATKRDLVVASTRALAKILPETTVRAQFRQIELFQQIFFILVCIHAGNPRVPPRVLASGPKPCRGNYIINAVYVYTFLNFFVENVLICAALITSCTTVLVFVIHPNVTFLLLFSL